MVSEQLRELLDDNGCSRRVEWQTFQPSGIKVHHYQAVLALEGTQIYSQLLPQTF